MHREIIGSLKGWPFESNLEWRTIEGREVRVVLPRERRKDSELGRVATLRAVPVRGGVKMFFSTNITNGSGVEETTLNMTFTGKFFLFLFQGLGSCACKKTHLGGMLCTVPRS
jgi:hypothetical protein